MLMQSQKGGGGIAPNHSHTGTGTKRVVSTTRRPFNHWERPGTQCTASWVGLGAGRDGIKNLAPTGSDARTVQVVASSYTNYDIPAAP